MAGQSGRRYPRFRKQSWKPRSSANRAAAGSVASGTTLAVTDPRMGHRHHEAELGRFISRDPIGFDGGLNLFIGAGTNPVTFSDPSGLDVAVIISGPVNSNPFGHTAVSVDSIHGDGGTYSFFTADPIGGDLSTYLEGQISRRDVRVYIIPTTLEQDRDLIKALDRCDNKPNPGKYEYFVEGDTCSGRDANALVEAGILKTPFNPYMFAQPRALENLVKSNYPSIKPLRFDKGQGVSPPTRAYLGNFTRRDK